MPITDGNLPADVRALLRRYRIAPSKGLGQNLLVDGAVVDTIIDVAQLTASDTVLEIGPGLGLLTRHLARQAGQVYAVELDRRMVELLGIELGGLPNLTIVNGDILEVDIPALLGESKTFKIVANLPYYITSAALRHLLEAARRPATMVLMVQWEVAERLVALPGKLSLLALSVQLYGRPSIVTRVPAAAFYPAPRVDSAVVHFSAFNQPAIAEPLIPLFFKLAKAGFGQKRKQLHNSLAANTELDDAAVRMVLNAAGIAPERRAETLALPEWQALCDAWPAAAAESLG